MSLFIHETRAVHPSRDFIADGRWCLACRNGFGITNECSHRLRQLRVARKCRRRFIKYVRSRFAKRFGFVPDRHITRFRGKCFKCRRNKSRCFRCNVLGGNFNFGSSRRECRELASNIRRFDTNRFGKHFEQHLFGFVGYDFNDGFGHNGNIGRDKCE